MSNAWFIVETRSGAVDGYYFNKKDIDALVKDLRLLFPTRTFKVLPASKRGRAPIEQSEQIAKRSWWLSEMRS